MSTFKYRAIDIHSTLSKLRIEVAEYKRDGGDMSYIDSDLLKFLGHTNGILKKQVQINDNRRNSSHINSCKIEYKNAYKRWTTEEDNFLEQSIKNNLSRSYIAEKLQRQVSAIDARIDKRGL